MTSAFQPDTAIAGCEPVAGLRPAIDLLYLAAQTLDDPDLQREVLALFDAQVVEVGNGFDRAGLEERRALAHGLRGAASSVGAFALAACAAGLETAPDDAELVARLRVLVGEARAFIASIDL